VQPRPLARFEPTPNSDVLDAFSPLADPQSLMEVDVTAPATARANPGPPPSPSGLRQNQSQAFNAPAPPRPHFFSPDPSPVPPPPVPPPPPPPPPMPFAPLALPVDPRETLSSPWTSPPVQPLNPVSLEPTATTLMPVVSPRVIPPPIPLPATSGSAVHYPEPRLQPRSPETPPVPPPLTPYPPSPSDTPSHVTLRPKPEVVPRLEPLVPSPGPSFPPPRRQTEIDWPRPAASPVEVSPPAPPTINVTIGRIEVRVHTAPGPSPRPARPSTPVMDLEKYLELRSGGQL